MRFTEDLKARVSKAQKKIVLPETNSRSVLKAAERVLADGFAKIVRVGKLSKLSTLKLTIVWTNFALTSQNVVKRKA